ncbi:RHS repeat domain-containing protein [Agriterribacter humi]|uniref:RHS repeat domain-containing protein n=1 Tax=Agriterribacter humi TaxID=1104781 RepID=UPI001263EDBA|nr:RHS repeat-associated core domain-containing protein [Agriterribacter humi]
MPTNYYYNSLNRVVKQNSPDGGTSEFWYDRLGRLAVSQNEEQKSPAVVNTENPAGRFSYTKYDELGRITEVGEKLSAGNVTETDARNQTWLDAWLSSGNNRQVTITQYDKEPTWVPSSLAGSLFNLRKRVAATALLSAGSTPASNRQAASYYSYDINGNVKTLTQENAALAAREATYVTGSTCLKQIKYEYDLVSGKVNKVLYQDGKWDQFYYQYRYDADNRLIEALSSRINESSHSLWVKEATYHYYLHGPLARVELGKNKVQGMDYAYTLQGWLKGVNGQFLDPDRDMSKDGKAGEPFANLGRDALAFTLGYYDNDYSPINGNINSPALAVQFQSPTYDVKGIVRDFTSGKPIFNGNISYATYAISEVENGQTYGKTYRYDQLNRLHQVMQHSAMPTNAVSWDKSSAKGFYSQPIIGYDANGNIITHLCNGGQDIAVPFRIDFLTYSYNKDPLTGALINNRLRHVKDAIAVGISSVDIDSQADDNYTYDKIGNLIGDVSENITHINWTVYGKIASITKSGNPMQYGYDATGNRITKTLSATKEGYYVRDAQGNVLALYAYDNSSFTWAEQHLYGSSRLGIVTPGFTIQSTTPLANANYNATGDPVTNGTEGKRMYELTNHLGNVMVTISDRKIGVDDDSDTEIDYYEAEVLTAQDYYAFGMLMPGRTYSNAGAKYKYGFNGKENDNEVKGEGNQQDYGMRIYDPRLGRFLSVDPLTNKYPELTPYQFASNRPIDGVDLDGLEYLKGRISVYGLNKFEVRSENYTRGNVWVKNNEIHKIVEDHENAEKVIRETSLPNPGEPLDLSVTRLKTNSSWNKKQENYRQKMVFKQNVKGASGDFVSAAIDAIKFGISLYYTNSDIQEMEEARTSLVALTDADNLVRKAISNKTFPDKLANPVFRTDLVNFITDGTLPEVDLTSAGYSEIVNAWGLVLYENRDAIIKGKFNFTSEYLIPDRKNLQTGSGTTHTINYWRKEGNSDPLLKKASELIKDRTPFKNDTIN